MMLIFAKNLIINITEMFQNIVISLLFFVSKYTKLKRGD